MREVNRTSKGNVNDLLKHAEQTLNQMNEEAKKGKNISPHFQNQFEEMKQSLQKISGNKKAEDLDENLRTRVLKAIDLLEHQQTVKKIPNIMAIVGEVKGQIQLLKKPAKIERGGEVQMGGGEGGGT